MLLREAAHREASVYEHLLNENIIGPPRFYGLEESNDNGQTVLVLEFLEAKPLKRSLDPEIWVLVARWLARTHSRFLNFEIQTPFDNLLRIHSQAFFQEWAIRAAAAAAECSKEAGRKTAEILDQYERVAAPLAQGPHTLVHGEFYCTNILFQPNGTGVRICPYDWETAALGCGILDLAYLTHQRNQLVDSSRLVHAYLEGWVEAGGAPISRESVFDQIRRSRIHENMYQIWVGVRYRTLQPEHVLRYVNRAEQFLQLLP